MSLERFQQASIGSRLHNRSPVYLTIPNIGSKLAISLTLYISSSGPASRIDHTPDELCCGPLTALPFQAPNHYLQHQQRLILEDSLDTTGSLTPRQGEVLSGRQVSPGAQA